MVLYICAKSLNSVTNPSRVIDRIRYTVIQCLTLNYDLDREPIFVQHTNCTSTQNTKIYEELFIGYKSDVPIYIADTKRDVKTDGWTDNVAKKICLPILWGA